MESNSPTRTATLRVLGQDYAGEVTSLVRLPVSEAALVLAQCLSEAAGSDADHAAAQVAGNLRDVLGLEIGETEPVTALSSRDANSFDEISALALQGEQLSPASR